MPAGVCQRKAVRTCDSTKRKQQLPDTPSAVDGWQGGRGGDPGGVAPGQPLFLQGDWRDEGAEPTLPARP